MPTIQENINVWNDPKSWDSENANNGESWSTAWGNTDNLWNNTLLKRITKYFPAKNCVEIAPGYGRITSYLEKEVKNLTLVDSASLCIEACKERFKNRPDMTYVVNDGKTIPVAPDSIDFIFSWDSLVHCEITEIESYLKEIKRVLVDNGGAFLHCSNAKRNGKTNHSRGLSVDAREICKICAQIGLGIEKIEEISWADDIFSDCLVSLKKSKEVLLTEWVENKGFMEEARG